MPTLITHTVIACSAVKAFSKKKVPLRFWLLSILCSIIPDADVIGFSFGIAYDDFLGHRGFSHSILFGFILSVLVVSVFFRDRRMFSNRWWKYVLFFFAVGASHGILDAFTNGGMGIALLSPFVDTRYFFPWRPVNVSPIGFNGFLSYYGLKVMISEIVYIWLPLLCLYFGYHVVIRKQG